jgi:hypothetical protein
LAHRGRQRGGVAVSDAEGDLLVVMAK